MDRTRRLCLRGSPCYPARLERLKDPPLALELQGSFEDADNAPKVAIVGTRQATELGLELAFVLATDLARAGVVVVSGGAIGVDTSAHRGALAGRGQTWAVLPTALDRPAPARNRALFAQIVAAGGGLMAERSSGHRHRFVARNRLVAALVDLVVVVEAFARSGTAATAAAARSVGVPVAAIPWSVRDPAGEGCLALLATGARAVRHARDVLDLLGIAPELRAAPRPQSPLEEALKRPRTAEELAAIFGRTVQSVLAELTELELAGSVSAWPGGRYAQRRL